MVARRSTYKTQGGWGGRVGRPVGGWVGAGGCAWVGGWVACYSRQGAAEIHILPGDRKPLRPPFLACASSLGSLGGKRFLYNFGCVGRPLPAACAAKQRGLLAFSWPTQSSPCAKLQARQFVLLFPPVKDMDLCPTLRGPAWGPLQALASVARAKRLKNATRE